MPFTSASLAPSLPSGTSTHFPLSSTIRSCCVQNKLILISSKTPVLDLKMMSEYIHCVQQSPFILLWISCLVMVPRRVPMTIYARSFCSLAGHGWAFRLKGERKPCGGIPRGYEGQVIPTTHHTHCHSVTGLSKSHTSNRNLEVLESCCPSQRRSSDPWVLGWAIVVKVLSRKILDHMSTASLNRTLFVLFHCISTLKVDVVMATLLRPFRTHLQRLGLYNTIVVGDFYPHAQHQS